MQEKYQPTKEDYEKAEETMTPEQKDASEDRATILDAKARNKKLIDTGGRFLKPEKNF